MTTRDYRWLRLVSTRDNVKARLATASVWFAVVVAGCARYIDPRVPEPIRPRVAPQGRVEYLLYRPSSYDRKRTWPLVVTCHGAFPDSPNRQIRSWTQFAESYGFLVVAPKLRKVELPWPSTTRDEVARLRENDRDVLAVLRHIQGSHNVSEDRVFIHGRSGGAHTALYSGLRHPDIFRAVAISDPKFDRLLLGDVADCVDSYQPVLVDHALADAITGKDAQRAATWLDDRCLNVVISSHGRFSGPDAQPAVDFFETVVRRYPWMHIRAIAADEDNPLQVRFRVKCSFRPTRVEWALGDGSTSSDADPLHTYTSPKTYVVSLAAHDPDGRTHHRRAALALPEVSLRPIPPESQPLDPGQGPDRAD